MVVRALGVLVAGLLLTSSWAWAAQEEEDVPPPPPAPAAPADPAPVAPVDPAPAPAATATSTAPATPAAPASKGKDKPEKQGKLFTILQITYYDGTEVLEAVPSSEAVWRMQEISADYRAWERADRLARVQWHTWFSKPLPENKDRTWVMAKPTPPRFNVQGKFDEQLDAEDRIRAFKAEELKKRERLWRSNDPQSVIYWDNFFENRKLTKSMLPQARLELLNREDQNVKRWPESKKHEVWDLVHFAEIRARQIVAEKSEKKDNLDILAVYNTQQDLLKPIYAQYKLDDDQWYVIWQEGDKNKWPIPKDAPK